VNVVLWVLQILLAALFLFGGGMKLVTPIEEMTKQMAMPGWFLRFIGVCELLGGLGLVLPWWLRIKPILTPIAAACLVVIMIGAVVVTIMSGPAVMAAIPAIVGALLAFVAHQRWRSLRG
jgi:hypothetical protein